VILGLAVAILVASLLFGLEALVGTRQLGRLIDKPPFPADGSRPTVSLVVAARDEARGIEAAVGSMLRQDYPGLEVVVVDDRSSDGTGAILDRMAAADSRLTVVHVSELPPGWLGKNHALQAGADRARGDWLLFTDADVKMAPEVVSRAVRYARDRGVDHLAALPDVTLPGLLLSAFVVHFFYSFVVFTKPWRARDPKSWFFVGVGAFNLVRRQAYQAVDGHRRLALRPDDDIKLGKVLKHAGFRQDLLLGFEVMSVEWYHSLGEMVRGLEKNMFAGVDYQIWLSVAGGLAQLMMAVVPLVALPFVGGAARMVLAAQVMLAAALFWVMAGKARVPRLAGLLYPVASLLFVAILWRTMILNLAHGGLQWRGTFYPLRELKANRV
jgi:cellulose synthase/poly-beta-1,6-N-acetylglucosamine synthase-like glycosyltransferase